MSATTPPATLAALPLGDDALILSHRLGEWAGHAPVLEEEVALANIALDLLGQARALYAELADVLGSEDEIAYLREERAFLNCQLVEQPNGDFAHTVVRQLFFSTYQQPLYAQLTPSLPLAAKAVREVAYHRDHAEQWTLRLGDGTEESHARTQRAVDALWRYTGELFRPVEGVDARWEELEEEWDTGIRAVLGQAGLTVPDSPRHGAWSAGAGRQGVHTEPFGRMLAEMQHLHRSHPGATW
ncbi:1,2-phenylacetyl-CoA epoxidase subunit PaaC [Streptomyces reniochalinae]|uniref:Phenylacetate-CoA oxygenase subunit PaaI n=1 Tax=Streptomyces reniochalinae TaxID=2250578 RepID=A0A367EGA5_9ACTN|nr:1,2-phenylacetyl-CoA epoxidase subunit PaaC [Streptomyces reniochalinae]RCG17136.1 phenylacetate-CoA oxygenase subunit PaaI [Streptomyces reniochalinae]